MTTSYVLEKNDGSVTIRMASSGFTLEEALSSAKGMLREMKPPVDPMFTPGNVLRFVTYVDRSRTSLVQVVSVEGRTFTGLDLLGRWVGIGESYNLWLVHPQQGHWEVV
jgi:hypothetical protein